MNKVQSKARSRRSGLLARQPIAARGSSLWAHKQQQCLLPVLLGHSTALHHPLTLQNSEPWRSAQHPSTRGRHSSAGACGTSALVLPHKQSYSHFTLLHDQQSSIPKWQYTEYSKTSSTKESIWLLRTNKLAGLFQVSFGSMLKYHDLTSSRVQKRSLTLSLDYSSLCETRKKNHVS